MIWIKKSFVRRHLLSCSKNKLYYCSPYLSTNHRTVDFGCRFDNKTDDQMGSGASVIHSRRGCVTSGECLPEAFFQTAAVFSRKYTGACTRHEKYKKNHGEVLKCPRSLSSFQNICVQFYIRMDVCLVPDTHTVPRRSLLISNLSESPPPPKVELLFPPPVELSKSINLSLYSSST